MLSITRKLVRSGRALWALILGCVGALILLPTGPARSFSRNTHQAQQTVAEYDSDRLARQSRLKTELRSTNHDTFAHALKVLSTADEEGAVAVWKVAIRNPDPVLKRMAWTLYRQAWPDLSRKESSPEVRHFDAPKEAVARAATAVGVNANVFSEDGSGCTAAIVRYSADRLIRAGFASTILFPSLSDMQEAARAGNDLARRMTADYRASAPIGDYQVRIAVVDLSKRATPAAGYSDWLGDPENILMRNGSLVAYLDVFASDGSPDSIANRVQRQYTLRGYSLTGFFTTEEFSRNVGGLFPGKSFPIRRQSTGAGGYKIDGSAMLNNGAFHSYAQALQEFTALAQGNPDIAEVVNLGSSFEGRQIFALKISANASTDDPSKPSVLITGCHHAREWISVEPPIYYANQLINGYSADDGIKYLVDHLQIWIVPVLNPDGLTFSQGSPNDDMDAIRLWRKNMQPINMPACSSGTGVDLNRNYDFEWRLPGDQPCPDYFDDVGASDNPLDDTFRGPAPDSELEVQAINVLTGDPNHHFQSRLDYHNFGQLELYPWGYQQTPSQDAANLGALATSMATLAKNVDGTTYTPEQAFDLYVTTGDSTDYAYAVNGVPAPFTVELPPPCCLFNVPESEIAPIDQESWPGALMLLNWSAGPPILESVQAYQLGAGGSFSNLIYSAHWTDSGSGRQLILDAHSAVLQAGPVQLKLQFSRPMNGAAPPTASLGPQAPFNQLSFVAANSAEGWHKTSYSNDTWIGETTLPTAIENGWTLAVSATDQTPLSLDGNPATVATYTTGSGGWQGYEDSLGAGASGGTDANNVLGGSTPIGSGPTIVVTSPSGAFRLASGDQCAVSWTLPQPLGFTVAQQQLWLSTDGGATFGELSHGIDPAAISSTITIPPAATTQARIKVVAGDSSLTNVVQGLDQSNFTIGANVGSAVRVTVDSSELLNQSWSDNGSGGMVSGEFQLQISLSVTNKGVVAIANPFLRIAALTKGNVLLSRDPIGTLSPSVIQSISPGSGVSLMPGQTTQMELVVGLVTEKKFALTANVFGVPVSGAISAKHPTTIWSGKPRNSSS